MTRSKCCVKEGKLVSVSGKRVVIRTGGMSANIESALPTRAIHPAHVCVENNNRHAVCRVEKMIRCRLNTELRRPGADPSRNLRYGYKSCASLLNDKLADLSDPLHFKND